jgi:predicted aspartyl protease
VFQKSYTGNILGIGASASASFLFSIDTGATTSFISQEFVDLYGIPCNKLEYPITVLSTGE